MQDIAKDFDQAQETLDNLSPDFIREVTKPFPPVIIEAIKANTIRNLIWSIESKGTQYHGATFYCNDAKPQSVREVIDQCVTQYVPEFQIVMNHNSIMFILPKDKRDALLKELGYNDNPELVAGIGPIELIDTLP